MDLSEFEVNRMITGFEPVKLSSKKPSADLIFEPQIKVWVPLIDICELRNKKCGTQPVMINDILVGCESLFSGVGPVPLDSLRRDLIEIGRVVVAGGRIVVRCSTLKTINEGGSIHVYGTVYFHRATKNAS